MKKNCPNEINYVVYMFQTSLSFVANFHIALTQKMKMKYFSINAWFLKLKII